MIVNIFNTVSAICNNYYFILCIQTTSFIFKAGLLFFLLAHILKTRKPSSSWFFLFIVVTCSAVEDLSWIISICRTLFDFPSKIIRDYIVSIAWSCNVFTYQALALFINSFNIRGNTLYRTFTYYVFLPISCVFFLFFIIERALNLQLLHYGEQFLVFYTNIILMPYTLFEALRILRKEVLPRIIQQQLKLSINFFLIPYLITNIWQVFPFIFVESQPTSHPEAVVISAILLIFTLLYFVKSIVRLRFLNLHDHVYDTQEFNFIYDFKTTLEEFGNASTISEVKMLSQQFLHKALKIDPQKVIFGIRKVYQVTDKEIFNSSNNAATHALIESFISQEDFACDPDTPENPGPAKILIYDEIAYTNFHEPTLTSRKLLSFLDAINADIFLPMYDQDRIIAYIAIARNARIKTFYTNVERDEMIVFTTYAAKIINLLQTRNLNELLKERKEIIDELYTKHQEITKYKESIQSFLKMNKGHSIGVLLYKNKNFHIVNEDATDILGCNPNVQVNDSVTKMITSLVSKIEKYRAPQSQIVKNIHDKRIVIAGLQHPDNSSIILMVHYAELSDVIEELIDHIKDPSNWDYLLYLETTQSGQLINHAIPGSGETLLNFKLELLKVALTKKALLIDVAEEDVVPMVELIHHVSLKETLHVLNLQTPITNQDTGITLFGINPLFNPLAQPVEALLERLNKKGILFIKNIHFLDIESQNNLAEFIRYGFYKVLKSERKMFSDVRIICSSNQDLAFLAEKNLFSKALFKELHKTSLVFPSLLTLPPGEIDELIEGFTQQSLSSTSSFNPLRLSDEDKKSILMQRPISLQDLKNRVRASLFTKSKKTESYQETTFDPAYNISDPKLAEAARLGKYALKDPHIMSMLWSKFQNQNKIALFLGVNRSSVNRRCKEYGIL